MIETEEVVARQIQYNADVIAIQRKGTLLILRPAEPKKMKKKEAEISKDNSSTKDETFALKYGFCGQQQNLNCLKIYSYIPYSDEKIAFQCVSR